jgi:hypothetical protein
VIELITFYSQKGVFKVNEYKDISEIDERLRGILDAMTNDKEYTDLTSQEYSFIVLIFKECTQRIPTAIDGFGQLYSIYQSYQALLKQSIDSNEVPKIEEVSA